MKYSIKIVLVLVLAGAIAALTLIVRIPTPGSFGYLNLGDIGVIFAGLFLRNFYGALAGGLGSAVADIVGGFFIFAPVTFVAKGLEAYVAGTLGIKHPLWLVIAVLVMVATYFTAEMFLPNMGWSAAISELFPNFIQASIGSVGGYLVFKGVQSSFPKSRNNVG
jgi:uncharacterized membrane protein